MNCQICNKNVATVHITEVAPAEPGEAVRAADDKHVCTACAQRLDIPYTVPVFTAKGAMKTFELLQESARRARREGRLACPDCGMTLAEFRSKGRLGCPKDYDVFQAHLDPLLERVHNAIRHVGDGPSEPVVADKKRQALTALRAQLEEAIQKEAYESAAKLRDEIQEIESKSLES